MTVRRRGGAWRRAAMGRASRGPVWVLRVWAAVWLAAAAALAAVPGPAVAQVGAAGAPLATALTLARRGEARADPWVVAAAARMLAAGLEAIGAATLPPVRLDGARPLADPVAAIAATARFLARGDARLLGYLDGLAGPAPPPGGPARILAFEISPGVPAQLRLTLPGPTTLFAAWPRGGAVGARVRDGGGAVLCREAALASARGCALPAGALRISFSNRSGRGALVILWGR